MQMRCRPLLPIAVVVSAVLVLAFGSAAHPATTNLQAVVGSDKTISLTADGKPVLQLRPGSYTIGVDDRSEVGNFHLQGPGVDVETGQTFVGQTTWTLTLGVGSYVYFSDPFADSVRGDFTVGEPPKPSLFATVSERAISLLTAGGTPVQQLDPGTYAIAVDDRASRQNFRLAGPNVSLHTQEQVAFSTVWDVTFSPGTYFFFSDLSPARLHGSFTVGSATRSAPNHTLLATVGPDIAIALLNANFSPVTRLRAGTYTVVVDDLSPDHNFHLFGRAANRTTSVQFVGTTRWRVTLKPGRYTFQCDPHQFLMRATFVVVRARKR
jgi:plastocyanin